MIFLAKMLESKNHEKQYHIIPFRFESNDYSNKKCYYIGDTIEKKAISLNRIYHIIIKTMTVPDEIAPNHFTPLGIPKSSLLRWIIARTPATK